MTARIKAGLGIELESAPPSCYSSLPNSSVQLGASVPQARHGMPSLRSSQGMQGLLSAEKGEAMVQLDVFSGGSGFKEGQRIAPESVTPGGGSIMPKDRPRSQHFGPRVQPCESQGTLSRQDTILGHGASSTRASEGLKSLLGNSNSKLKHGAMVPLQVSPTASQGSNQEMPSEHLVLEQAKTRVRVEVDIVLESNACVQGGCLKGLVKICVRERSRHEPRILVAEGKVRLLGFECIPHVDDRHTFYQSAESFSTICPDWDIYLDSGLDEQGFGYAREGVHVFPFAMHLPLDGVSGNPKGVLNINSGVSVRYIAMVSVKVKDSETGRRSIAHFYRDCEIWPRFDPSTVLASAPRPLQCTTSKSLFMGGPRNVKLTALLNRLYWVAGQRCYVKVIVDNDTKKTIKRLTLLLVRRTTVFRPSPELDTGLRGDPDACHTATTYREVAETTLEMAQRVTKGHASTKGWWTGIDPGERLEFSHFILLPSEALSITRGRLLEVEYCIRISISAGSLTSDVFVDLPIRIINFLSIDTPVLFLDTTPDNSACGRSVSDYTQVCSVNCSLLPQSRSKSDVGSLSIGEKLNGGFMKSRSISADGHMADSEARPATRRRDNCHDALLDHELGNLDGAENSDEEVDLVISTARVDQGKIRFTSDSDPCGDADQISTTRNVSPMSEATDYTASHPRTRSKTTSDIPYLKGGRPNSFATRVQEKMANVEKDFIVSSDQLDGTGVDVTTPRPRSGWSASHTAPDGSSTISYPSYSNLTSLEDPTLTNHRQVPCHPIQASGSESNSRVDPGAGSRNTDIDIKSKQVRERPEVKRQSVSKSGLAVDGSVRIDHGMDMERGKGVDKTSEVKKRIEAFEAKTRDQ